MEILGVALAAVIGLTLGMLGGGGSILAVPVFVYLLGFGIKQSVAMSLAVVGAVSLFGAVGHWRAGNVNLRVALAFGTVAMLGTFAGARLAAYVSGPAQLVLFAAVMLLTAAFMLRGSPGEAHEADAFRAPPPPPGIPAGAAAPQLQPSPERLPLGLVVAEGLAVGVLTGLVGVGGGFLIVPALVLLARIPMKQAVGTSLVVIAMKSATGFLGYLGQVEVPWGFMLVFTSVAVGGILLGTYLVRFVSPSALRRGFAMFLLAMGGFILYQNRTVLLPHAELDAHPSAPASAGG